MKNRTTVLGVCMLLYSIFSFAQKESVPVNEPYYDKPKLFNSLPDNIPVTAGYLDNLLHTTLGRSVNTNLTNDHPFTGEVVSVSSKSGNSIQTVVIRSSNFRGANMTLSRITHADGSISYTGRILSFQHGDLFELQNQKGQLVFVKRNYYDLVNE